MKTKTSPWFERKVCYDKMQETGLQKKILGRPLSCTTSTNCSTACGFGIKKRR